MTDAGDSGTEWVPRFGMSEVPRERAELIRGLFELAAWVADHPELPLPRVQARVFPMDSVGDGATFAELSAVVDRVADALGVAAELSRGGHYLAEAQFGCVEVSSFAIPPAEQPAYRAHLTYARNVQPDQAPGGAR